MVMLRTLTNTGSVGERLTEPSEAARQVRSISSRRCRAAVCALCGFALGVLFGLEASAQQDVKPQPEEVPPVNTGPSPPASVPSAAASWQQSLVARLAKVQRYPAEARGAQGVVNLTFSIDRHGAVVSSRIVKSSGSAVLDAEALDLIKRAAPLPPPPADIADSELSFIVPIRFRTH
jgi:TonB family protein